MYKFIIPLFALAFLLVSCNKQTTTPPTPVNENQETGAAADVPFDGQILSGKHVVVMKTSKGDITIELDADAAPKTVTNFIALAKGGYYDDLTFHRVIPDFMVQAGDPNGDGTGGASVFGETFEDEINADTYNLDEITFGERAKGQQLPPDVANMTLKEYFEKMGYVYNENLTSLPMTRGAIAMANRGPNSNGSQFFIIQAEATPWLEGQHTVFGKVTDGMEIIDDIVKVERGPGDRPVDPITYTIEVQE